MCILVPLLFQTWKKDSLAEPFKLQMPKQHVPIGGKFEIRVRINTDSLRGEDIRLNFVTNNTIQIHDSSALSISGTAVKRGKIRITLEIPKLNVSDTSVLEIGYSDEIKILAIGNSFSEDAVEKNLHKMFTSAGQNVIICTMSISGANFFDHINAISKPNYSFRNIKRDGSREYQNNKSLDFAINNEDWDYISFQQSSSLSGIPDSYDALRELYEWVKGENRNEETNYILHMTWAYSNSFPAYDSNQNKRYDAILASYQNARNMIPVKFVVPTGMAIQKARLRFDDHLLTSDGWHLSSLGSLIAESTWYHTISKKPLLTNPYFIASLSETDQKTIASAVESSAFEIKNNPN